jgi:hypothetical protein
LHVKTRRGLAMAPAAFDERPAVSSLSESQMPN